jgi:hypothetical protein
MMKPSVTVFRKFENHYNKYYAKNTLPIPAQFASDILEQHAALQHGSAHKQAVYKEALKLIEDVKNRAEKAHPSVVKDERTLLPRPSSANVTGVFNLSDSDEVMSQEWVDSSDPFEFENGVPDDCMSAISDSIHVSRDTAERDLDLLISHEEEEEDSVVPEEQSQKRKRETHLVLTRDGVLAGLLPWTYDSILLIKLNGSGDGTFVVKFKPTRLDKKYIVMDGIKLSDIRTFMDTQL